MLAFEPIGLRIGDRMDVLVQPFEWQSCPVVLSGLPEAPQWQPVIAWFERWFDAEEVRPVGENGLSGVVHFLDDPKFEAGAGRLIVDLGSAPIEAFEELLSALVATGAGRAVIGTSVA